jgi:hypothetical protein
MNKTRLSAQQVEGLSETIEGIHANVPVCDSRFGIRGKELPWYTGATLDALGKNLSTMGSRLAETSMPDGGTPAIIYVASDASFVKQIGAENDGSVHIQAFADKDLLVPIWTLMFRIPGSPSSSTVCEGESVPEILDFVDRMGIQTVHHCMDNQAVPYIMHKGFDKGMRTKKMDRLAFESKEQFLWKEIEIKYKRARARNVDYTIHYVAAHTDDPAKKAKIDEKLRGSKPADKKMQQQMEYMTRLGLSRDRLETLNQIQDKGADCAMTTLAKPRKSLARLPSHVNLVKDDTSNRFTIMETPLIAYMDALDLEHRLRKLRAQKQWHNVLQDSASESVLADWMVAQSKGSLAKFAMHAITKNLATNKNLQRWYPTEHNSECGSCGGGVEDGAHVLTCITRDWITLDPIKQWNQALMTRTKSKSNRYTRFMTSSGPTWWPGRPVARGLPDEIKLRQRSSEQRQHQLFTIPACIIDEVRMQEAPEQQERILNIMQTSVLSLARAAWDQRNARKDRRKQSNENSRKRRRKVLAQMSYHRKTKDMERSKLEHGQTTLDGWMDQSNGNRIEEISPQVLQLGGFLSPEDVEPRQVRDN